MKKFLVVLLLGLVLLPGFCLAEGFLDEAKSELGGFQKNMGAVDTPLTSIIGRIVNVILGLLGVILLFIVLYAGFLWMTAGGNEETVGKAKKWMLNGVIGLIIVLLAYAIANFVIVKLSGALT